MKTLIIATDFSEGASWAEDYALDLARQFHLRLVIIHVYPETEGLLHLTPEALFDSTEDGQALAYSQLKQVRDRLRHRAGGTVDISVFTRQGLFDSVMGDEVQRFGADLVVMGAVGKLPQENRFFGSRAIDMIGQTRVPLLLIPPHVQYHTIQTVVFALDLSNMIDAVSLDNAIHLANLFQATVDLVCVEDESNRAADREAAEHIRHMLRHLPHTISFLSGSDFVNKLNEFVAEHKSDMVIMMPRPSGRLSTYLLESFPRQIAYQEAVPIVATV